MSPRIASALSAALVLALTGCAGNATTALESRTPSQTVVVTAKSLTLEDGTELPYSNADDVLDFLTAQLGPAATPSPSPEDWYASMGTSYQWQGVSLVTINDRSAVIEVTSTDAITFTTPSGVVVGTSRDEALAAGASDMQVDLNGTGVSNFFADDVHTVPDAVSLTQPDSPGSQYVELEITDGAVARISAPATDFGEH